MHKKIIITAPSLDPKDNVSGISAVARFIIANNPSCEYIHFMIGKKDNERGGLLQRCVRVWNMYRKWKRFLKENPNAIIHYNFPLDVKSVIRDFFFIRYALHNRRQMVIHIHGGLYLTKKSRPWIINKMMRTIFSCDAPFIVLSELEKKAIQTEFKTKHVEVLPNCVDLNDAAAFERTVKGKGEILTMGYLGRIEENKGIDWLLSACCELRRENIMFKLILAGKEEVPGAYLNTFSDYIGDRFHYAGVVSGEDKCAFLRSLDVFVLPSYFEGLPMSLLECMSYGAVPLTTAVGSIPEVVKDGENGIIIKVRDTRTIVDGFKRLNDNRQMLKQLSENAKKSIFTNFSPEKYIKKLNMLYE